MNNKLVFLIFNLIFINKLINVSGELDVLERSINGTETLPIGLTDKQLSIQRYLAWLTILQYDVSANGTEQYGWNGWEDNYDNNQADLPSVRYPLAFLGYTVAAIVYKTPSFRELSVKLLDNCIKRMIQQHQYEYISMYWQNTSFFPDPVSHENIMYSGHLAQLIALYESISGDFKYTYKGWDFIWSNNSVIHYDAMKLMTTIYNQVVEEETGGVACEPGSIFVVCNNHPRLAFNLYDSIHGTNFSNTNIKWEKWIKEHAKAPISDYRYFKIEYYKPIHSWIPLYGTSGNDVWALSFIDPWIVDKEFAANGLKRLYESIEWRRPAPDQEYLDSGIFGKISEMNTWLASSMYPLVEHQYGQFSTRFNRSLNVYNWFEKNFGLLQQIENNTCKNTYIYNITDPNYKIWTVSNLLMSMITDNSSFSKMYNKPFYKEFFEGQPELVGIIYPKLHVKYAFNNQIQNSMEFGLLTDCSTTLSNVSFSIKNVVTFKKATLACNKNVIDITNQSSFSSETKILSINSISIAFDCINHFEIIF